MPKRHCPAEPDSIGLLCHLEPGHPGEWHWDGIDDITWRQGRHAPPAHTDNPEGAQQ